MSAPAPVELARVNRIGLLHGDELGADLGDLLGVSGHGRICDESTLASRRVMVGAWQSRPVLAGLRSARGGERGPGRPQRGAAHGGEKIAAPQHGRRPARSMPGGRRRRHRVEDGEGLEVVPGDETQEGEGGKRPDHGPQKHSQGEGQASAPPSPRVGRGPDVRITARHRGSVRHRRLVGVSALEPGRLRRRGGGGPASAGSAR